MEWPSPLSKGQVHLAARACSPPLPTKHYRYVVQLQVLHRTGAGGRTWDVLTMGLRIVRVPGSCNGVCHADSLRCSWVLRTYWYPLTSRATFSSLWIICFFVGVCQSAPHQSLAVRSRFLEGCLVVFPSSSSSIVVVVHRRHRPSSSSSIVHRRRRRPSSIVVVVVRRRRRRPSSSSSVVVVVRRRRRPSSSSSSIVVVVHRRRRRRPSSSSSSIVVVITHHRHHTLLPSHSPLYSHVIAIFILVSSLFAMVSSPPTQPITIVSSPPTHPITIVYSLTILMPIPTVVYSSPLNPDRTIVAVPSFFALRRRSWLIVIRHHMLTVFIITRVPTTWKHVHTALSCWHVKLPFP